MTVATSYGGTPPGITGTHYGGSSLGVLGADVPAAGADGPGYLYAALSLPADAAKAVRGPITRWPSGALTVYEDSSFTYIGATDYALYALYVDGVASSVDVGHGPGIGRFDLLVGSTSELTGAVQLDTAAAAGTMTGGTPSGLTGGPALDDVLAAGAMAQEGASGISGAVQLDEVLAGGALTGGAASELGGGVQLDAAQAAGELQGAVVSELGSAVRLGDVLPGGTLLGDVSAVLAVGRRVVQLPAPGELARTIYVQAGDMDREPTLLDDVLVDEADTVTFPVARALAEGEVMTSPVITCAYHQGKPDADAAARVSTPHQVVAGNVVQLISGAQADTWYLIKGKFALSSGRVLVGRGIFKGRA